MTSSAAAQAPADRPRIGITFDWIEKGSFSPRAHYAIRDSYFQAVWDTGGLPVGIPLVPEAQLDYLSMVDGVIVPGGDHPTPAGWYVTPPENHPTHPRGEIDLAFIRRALDADVPMLCICAGIQALGVASGGKLYLKVVAEHAGAQSHRGVDPTQRHHGISIEPDSLLARVTGTTSFDVNSHHNEAVAQVGPASGPYPARVVATAPDGVIEAIEVPGKAFALGVQWHPEFFLEDGSPDRRIFEGLVAAARLRADQRCALANGV